MDEMQCRVASMSWCLEKSVYEVIKEEGHY